MNTARTIRRLLALLGCALVAATVLAPAPPAHADPQSRMMLVMDSSGSMQEKLPGGQRRIQAAKQALNTVIDTLPSEQAVGLRVYGAEVFDKSEKGACTDSQRVVDLGTDNRGALRAAVKQYKPYGETPIGYALQQAGADLGQTGQRTVVLVSDGEPTCQPDPCQVAGELAEQGIELKIEVVGLDVSGEARRILQCVAEEGNGNYYDADDADDLTRALDTVATRAMRPYKPTGKPITGSETSEDAPAITSGDWIDELGGLNKERSELFYSFHRTVPGSTLHLSAAITTQDDYDGLTLEVIGEQYQCASASEVQRVETGQVISAGLTAPGYTDWNEECTDNDDFVIRLTRGRDHSSGTGSDNAVPVEIRVEEEPPVESVDALPEDVGEPEFSEPKLKNPGRIVGGSSFAEATETEPGAYRGNIVPGEVQIFAVDVGWGQHLTSVAEVAPLTSKLDEEGASDTDLTAQLFSPTRADAHNPFESDTQGPLGSEGVQVSTTSYPVVYRNRDSYSDSQAANNRAGTYYVVLALTPDPGASYQVPYTLGIATDGEVQGEPTYLEEGTAPSASASASGSAEPSASADPTVTPSPSGTPSSTPVTGPTGEPTVVTSPPDDDPGLLRPLGWVLRGVGVLAVLGGVLTALIFVLRGRS